VADGIAISERNCTIPPDEVVRGRGYAETLPAIAGVAVTPAGELWVLRGAVADEPRQIDVFSKLGDYLGTLSPDRPFRLRSPRTTGSSPWSSIPCRYHRWQPIECGAGRRLKPHVPRISSILIASW
jgi:hypothetical protein